MRICGVDEAGKGAVIGPMVVAGVLVEDEEALREIGVRDSKKLSRRRREELFHRITSSCSVEVIEISAKELDEMMKERTINEILLDAHSKIIESLKPDVAYVDSVDVLEERFRDRLRRKLGCEIISKHGADELYPCVSAASIVAKVIRDRRVREIEKELKSEIGSGYPGDPRTRRFLEEWFREHRVPPPHARVSWETIKRFLK